MSAPGILRYSYTLVSVDSAEAGVVTVASVAYSYAVVDPPASSKQLAQRAFHLDSHQLLRLPARPIPGGLDIIL